MENNFFERVYEAVKQIPKGKVSTYGDIARASARRGQAVRSAGRCTVTLMKG